MKETLYQLILDQSERLLDMSDRIFDNPEYDGEEHFASGLLEDYLEENGFQVQRGLTGWPTAFRATWKPPDRPAVRVRRPAPAGPRLRPPDAGALHLRHRRCPEERRLRPAL